MNLNYSIQQLAEMVEGKVIGNPQLLVKSISVNSRQMVNAKNTLFVTLNGNKSKGTDFIQDFKDKGGHMVLVEKEVNISGLTQIIVNHPLKALQKIAQFHRLQFDIPIIGITGSNGKTTVKEWLFHLIKNQFNVCRSPKSYNSQLGVALSLLELDSSHQIGIFEAGISQTGEMEVLLQMIQPTIGIFTGIGDAHQENFDSLEQKKSEKYILFQSVEKLFEAKSLCPYEMPYSDLASLQNAHLAVECALYIGVDINEVKKQLQSLPSLTMRMEKMDGKEGNIILNDTYTLDQKALELGLSQLNEIKQDKNAVLLMAPSEDFKWTDELIDIIQTAQLNCIYIIGKNIPSFPFQVQTYESVNEFLQSPPVIQQSVMLVTGSRSSQAERILPVFMAKKHISQLIINWSAIRHNLNYYRQHLQPNTSILSMVKAQSYGGGLVEMAQFLEQEKVNYFGVAYADEGVILRNNEIKTPIMVMNPEAGAFDDITEHQLEPSIYSFELLDAFVGHLIRHGIKHYPIHIKLNTGMNRLGFSENHIKELTAQLKAQPEVYVQSVFSHLSVADDENEKAFTQSQIDAFAQMTQAIEHGLGYGFIKHLANSAGAIHYPQAQFDMVRLGIGMYGYLSRDSELEPAISLSSQISQINKVNSGDSVGYGRNYKATTDREIAVVPVGYADGLRRALGNGNWSVVVNGKKALIVGNICMDMCMIDVTDIKTHVGDKVEIFGHQISLFDMADELNTIPYEIISSISTRIHRVYIEE